jgi:hypothetical protein
MIFILLLGLAALSLSCAAAYFSVIGLAQTFAGAFYPVIIMGSAIELGKLLAVSFLYRHWNQINLVFKTLLSFMVVVVMILTSTGIFGFLSNAYQEDTQSLKHLDNTKPLILKEKEELLFRKRQIDADIAALPSNYVSGRQRLMKSYGPELERINTKIEELNGELRKLTTETIKEEGHVGPIIFVARVFGKEVDDAIKYLTLMIIFVFDPFAILLVIATNIAIFRKKTKTSTIPNPDTEHSVILDGLVEKEKIKKDIFKNS